MHTLSQLPEANLLISKLYIILTHILEDGFRFTSSQYTQPLPAHPLTFLVLWATRGAYRGQALLPHDGSRGTEVPAVPTETFHRKHSFLHKHIRVVRKSQRWPCTLLAGLPGVLPSSQRGGQGICSLDRPGV